MSILIKMEMPKDCQHCPINEDAACSIAPNFDCLNSDTFLVADGARRDDCPLIEIPNIYIDIAKAFMTELTDKVCRKGDEDNEHLN